VPPSRRRRSNRSLDLSPAGDVELLVAEALDLMEATPEPALASFSHRPAELAWCSSSHASQALHEPKGRMGRSGGLAIDGRASIPHRARPRATRGRS
jgi:hypothetical protein